MSAINPLASSNHLLKRLESDMRYTGCSYPNEHAGTYFQKFAGFVACHHLGT